MAQHAFISHSHRDAEAAMQILAALEQRGVKCWTAPRDVPPGGSYAEAILTAIENASCFVLVYTENSNVSPHVLREVERALSLGINIMPVRFDGSSVSKSLDYLLATVHWLSVIGEPRSSSIDHAAERIAACVVEKGDGAPPLREVPPPAMPVPPPVLPPLAATPPPARPVGSAALLLWIGLLLLAVAGVIFAVQTVRHALPKENSTIAATASPADTAAAQVAIVAATPPIPEPPAPPPASEPPVTEDTTAAEETPTAAESQTEPEATPPPLAQNIARLAPVDVVKRYFGYLSDHNTIKAYELLSTDYRTRENFVTYTRNFASTETLRLVSAHAVSTRGDVATVEVTFDKNNRKFGWIRWRGPIQLTDDPSGWRINSLKGLRASSIRR
jgi:hypothetical protein